ncbi:hypothetical protein NMY3_00693 [Candidatus Nitrosocosmicus oleophilus]|uniref:Uncharacterized protein n=1 Tax=Candidatus Nitrosocosmicus oleophilus TaxID=1353260 RepID=A0A654M6B8_9ARCH|nr:hypothetical protein NMY3_00693 [Candidatus Nitrosocosmicus oleophilus]
MVILIKSLEFFPKACQLINTWLESNGYAAKNNMELL